MRNRIVMLTLALVLVLACTACTKSESGTEASGGEQSKVTLVNLRDAVKEAAKDLEEAKKSSKRLHFEEIAPYYRAVDTVYDIRVGTNDYYKGIQDEKEMLEEQMKLVRFFVGDEALDMNCFETEYSSEANIFTPEKYDDYDAFMASKYDTFLDFYEDLQAGKKFHPSYLVYAEQTEEKMRYIDIFATLGSMHWDLGVCYDAVREHSMKDEGQQQMDTPYFITSDGRKKYEAVYDVYHTNTKLDDSYPLLDGTISIRDAIASAEHYLNEVVPVEGEEHVRLVIERVYVHKISDALYAFRYEIKRQMYGVNMPYESQDASTTNLDFWSDSTQAYQIEKDKIDICDGFKKVVNLKTEKEIKEVLPLRDAIGILEDEIGDNSTYSVFGVELGYLFLCDDGWSGTDAGSGSVCWVFKTYNESDQHYVGFYVDADSGEVTAVDRIRY